MYTRAAFFAGCGKDIGTSAEYGGNEVGIDLRAIKKPFN
jgi:hypothetical protein